MTAVLTLPCHTGSVARRVTCPSFVGREAELHRLEEVADAATRAAQVVLLSGDAGVGKTRLIDELCARWRARGGSSAVGGCVDLGEVAVGYGPLIDVLRSLRASLGAEQLDRLLQETAPELLPLVSGGHSGQQVRQGAVLAHTVALLEELGGRLPGLLVVFEDVHWADASTRDLVAFLARHLRHEKVALVVSYRADDVHRRHPLRPLLAELTRSPTVEHLRLDRMSRSELTVLMTGVTGAVPSDDVVDQVVARSEGNPFYAEELLAARSGSGHLPPTLRDAVLTRVAPLPEAVQAVLREAALLGGDIDERLLVAASGRPPREVADSLREAVAHHILVADSRGCRFRHALVREVLHDDLLHGERQRLHEAAAAALATQPELAADTEHVRWALLAHHWTAAQDQPKALTASVRAGAAAQQVGALADAAAHYQRALDLWPRVPGAEAGAGMTRVDLLVCAADAVSHAGSPGRAVTLVQTALALLGDEAEPEAHAALLERLGHHRWVACDEAGSGRAREAAVALLADRPPSVTQALALAAWGRHQMLVDRYVEAEAILYAALAVADATGCQPARSGALSGLGFALVKLGRVEEGLASARRSLDVAQEAGLADDISLAYVNLSATLLAATRCEEAAQVAAAGLEHARRVGMLASDGVLLAYGGAEALFCLGAWNDAVALLTGLPAGVEGPHGTTGAVISARIAFLRGQSDLAAHHRDRSLTVVPGDAGSAPEALLCAALIAGRDGAFDEARRYWLAAFAIVERSEDLLLAAVVCAAAMEVEADRVQAGRVRGSWGEAEVAAARTAADELRNRNTVLFDSLAARGIPSLADTAAHLAVAEAEHARVWERSDPDLWARVAERWDILRFPFPAAVARFREADAVLRVRGSRPRAAAAARAALSTAERLGAVPLADQVRQLAQRGRLDLAEQPAPAPAAADPLRELGISPRESEVLRLLALGRTNRQIGRELFISEKTASVHVTHLLRKLNVASRIEAAAIAQRLIPPTPR